MRVKIYTFSYNRPDFISLQYRSINKFVKETVEFIVINNGQTPPLKEQIEQQCALLGIKQHKLDVPYPYNANPSESHGFLLQWTFNHLVIHDKNCISCFMDSDMFFIRKISIAKFLNGAAIAGIPQQKQHISYLWPNLLFMHMDRIPLMHEMNFMCGQIEGVRVDTGGYLYDWLKKNKNLKIKYLPDILPIHSSNNNLHLLPEDVRKNYMDDYEFIFNDDFILHYGRGSNWDHRHAQYHHSKTALLFHFVNGCINGSLKLPNK